jgi:hypothetical protein
MALSERALGRHESYRRMFDESLKGSMIDSIRDATQANLPLIGESLKVAIAASGRKIQRGKPGPRPNQIGDPNQDEQEILL